MAHLIFFIVISGKPKSAEFILVYFSREQSSITFDRCRILAVSDTVLNLSMQTRVEK